MAEIPIEKLDEQLNCSICLDTYTDPKILQCFHVYCQKCLVKLVFRNQQGQLSLSCPICRHVTPVPPNGTRGLQSAFHINRLLETIEEHKKASDTTIASVRVMASKPKSLCCPNHDRRVELYCETCEELICCKCTLKGGEHQDHDYKDIDESFQRYKEEVTPLLGLIKEQEINITEVLAQLNKCCDEIIQQQTAVVAKIVESSKELHIMIDKRQNELIEHLEQITSKKLRRLAIQLKPFWYS